MTILITGATGLIGKELVRLLLEKGHTIHYLTTSRDKIEAESNYIGFHWNPQLMVIDENCLFNVDVIIHLAGANIAKRWTNAYKQEIIESRILSGELLFNLVKKTPNQVKQIISASGSAVYPDSIAKAYDESAIETEDSFLSNVVQKWEASVNTFQRLGIKVCKLRTGVVLSNKDGALPQMVKPVQMGFGSVMGSGKQIVSWVHIDDLVRLYVFAMDKEWEGVYNAVSPNPVSNETLTKTIAKTLHKSIWLPNTPEFVMRLILGEMRYLLFSSKNLSADKVRAGGFTFEFPDIRQALDDLYP